MLPNEYQMQLQQYVVYPQDHWQEYLPMALFGEMGEVANLIKKSMRNGTVQREKMVDEFGDLMFYLARLGSEANVSFQEFFDWADEFDPPKVRESIRLFFRQLIIFDNLMEKNTPHESTVRLYGGSLLEPVLYLMLSYGITIDEVFEANLLKVSERAKEGNLKHE